TIDLLRAQNYWARVACRLVAPAGHGSEKPLKKADDDRVNPPDPIIVHLISWPAARGFLWFCLTTGVLLVIQSQWPSSVASAQSTVVSDTPRVQPVDSSNVVRPGDMIRLKVWREPDMSGDALVNEAGIATLPRIGAMEVANLSSDSLRRFLVNTYSKDLRDPAIDITVLRRVRILGAVRNPNVYQVKTTMTEGEDMALAGGATPDGKQDEVELRRQGELHATKLSREMKLSETPVRSGDQLYVPERSWFSRNTGLVLGGVGTLTSILFLVLRR